MGRSQPRTQSSPAKNQMWSCSAPGLTLSLDEHVNDWGQGWGVRRPLSGTKGADYKLRQNKRF